MNKQSIISKLEETLEKLPQEKVLEVADFADFILRKMEERSLTEGIQLLASKSTTFEYLLDEEDLYNEKDIKEK
jgi:hypothetical protein